MNFGLNTSLLIFSLNLCFIYKTNGDGYDSIKNSSGYDGGLEIGEMTKYMTKGQVAVL